MHDRIDVGPPLTIIFIDTGMADRQFWDRSGDVVELVDTPVLEAGPQGWEFKSPRPHMASRKKRRQKRSLRLPGK